MIMVVLQQVQSHLGMMMTESMRSVFWLDRWRLLEKAAKIRMTRNQMMLHTAHIENMQKLFRSHRAELDFDKGLIVASLKSGKDFDLKQEVEIGPRKKKRGRKITEIENIKRG